MGKVFFRVGETGKGHAAKLAMNLQIALIYEGFAEGLTLAANLAWMLKPCAANSSLHDSLRRRRLQGPFVLKRDFTPNFPMKLMHKDIKLMLEAAKEARVKLPALEIVEEIYDVAVRGRRRRLDYWPIITLLEKWRGSKSKGLRRKSFYSTAEPFQTVPELLS